MKIVFMGTPDFAVASLSALCEAGYVPAAVVTVPDKPAGRGQKLSQSPVKQFALHRGIRLLQPVKLKDADFVSALRDMKADLFIVVAFRMLPEVVWTMPRLGTFNLHASLLPAYRGAAPINHAVMKGERVTGVTTFRLRHEIDTGDILFREEVPIGQNMTAGELHDELMAKGAELLVRTVKTIHESDSTGTPLQFIRQDERDVSHAPKLFREGCRINWNHTPAEVHNFIRGLSPYPGAFTTLADGDHRQHLKILISAPSDKTAGDFPGRVDTDFKTFFRVSCRGGSLNLLEVQPEGRKRLPIAEFLRGFRSVTGELSCI